MNNRKKRCANPACRRVFTYAAGEKINCPWCGDASGRTDGYQWIAWRKGSFRFGVDRIPVLGKGFYKVRLERLVTSKKLAAIKAYRAASAVAPGLRESKMTVEGVAEGRPHTMVDLTADQVLLLMREGQMDLSYRPTGKKRRAERV